MSCSGGSHNSGTNLPITKEIDKTIYCPTIEAAIIMTKKRKQSADELLHRYSEETVKLESATSPISPRDKPSSPLLESLRRNLNRVVTLSIDVLIIEENVRRRVEQESPEFCALVDSIREQGVRQNIIVDLQDEDEQNFRVVVIAGQRRTLAAQRAGRKQVAALVLRLGKRGDRLVEGLAENLLREDLHCVDLAEAYAALIEEGWTEAEIAEKFERRRRTILQFIRLSKYPERAKALIRENQRIFTTYLLFNKFIAKTWKSEDDLVRALNQVVEGNQKIKASPPKPLTKEGQRLLKSINRYNGLSSKVSGDNNAGKIIISYKNQTAFEKLISLFEQD